MRLHGLAAIALVLSAAIAQARPAPDRVDGTADFGAEPASPAARFAARAILQANGQRGHAFAVVDKAGARLYVFDARGRLLGAAPALLGQATGDDTVPGVGSKPPSQVLPQERTTPAGRFEAEPGRNLDGDRVVWVDYDSGFAIHRVRRGASYAPRLQRLGAASPAAHRVSLGCVVVASEFFDRVVWPVLGQGQAVVYVLPETRPLASLFPAPTLALDEGRDTAAR